MQTILGILVCFGALLFLLIAGGGLCIFRRATGFPCPGCGMTRAVLAALHGDFSAAFAYHPLWILLPVFTYLLLRNVFPQVFPWSSSARYQKAEHFAVIVILTAVLSVYLFRIAGGWRG